MNTLTLGSKAKNFTALTLTGQRITPDLAQPTILCFAMPQVHSSRLVVGYLRRLKEQLPELMICIVLQGSEASVKDYGQDYLDNIDAIHDEDLFISGLYEVSHLATTYLIEETTIQQGFTGFNRHSMNKLAERCAEAFGKAAKELITVADNKGDYELAERGLR